MRVTGTESATSTIEVIRVRHLSFGYPEVPSVVDGTLDARLGNGSRFSLAVAPGQHSIEVRAFLAATGTAELNVAKGEAVEIYCGPDWSEAAGRCAASLV